MAYRFQFDLRRLLLLTGAIAVVLAIGMVIGRSLELTIAQTIAATAGVGLPPLLLVIFVAVLNQLKPGQASAKHVRILFGVAGFVFLFLLPALTDWIFVRFLFEPWFL